MKKNKHAVVTGGAGFIGSHLCERLLKEGFRVTCLDNLITGKKENIHAILGHKNFRFIHHNVATYISVTGAVDYVLHFASPASPEDYLKFPIQTLKVGSLGTHNALGLAKAKKAKFLLASTSEVYGDPQVHPQPETYWGHVNSVGFRGCYDEAKRFAEAMTMAYHRVHKIDTRIIRIFNTYGPRMRMQDGRVVPNFVFQALHNKPMTVYGNGSQTRSFCYVTDLIEGIVRVMRARENNPINLGNPCEFSILELAKHIIALTQTKSKIIFKPLPQDDPRQRKPDITKAKRLLSWQPVVQLKQGLTSTIEWFRNNP
ncbi:MAG: SDR family oxidoreductase [Candidatus Omnitrophica bacterium]|nr:SDR family oxidoreductase [Candidatus Omnitrophota bacterium]